MGFRYPVEWFRTIEAYTFVGKDIFVDQIVFHHPVIEEVLIRAVGVDR